VLRIYKAKVAAGGRIELIEPPNWQKMNVKFVVAGGSLLLHYDSGMLTLKAPPTGIECNKIMLFPLFGRNFQVLGLREIDTPISAILEELHSRLEFSPLLPQEDMTTKLRDLMAKTAPKALPKSLPIVAKAAANTRVGQPKVATTSPFATKPVEKGTVSSGLPVPMSSLFPNATRGQKIVAAAKEMNEKRSPPAASLNTMGTYLQPQAQAQAHAKPKARSGDDRGFGGDSHTVNAAPLGGGALPKPIGKTYAKPLATTVFDDVDDDDLDPFVFAGTAPHAKSPAPSQTIKSSAPSKLAPKRPFATLLPTAEDRGGFRNLGNTCYMNAVLQALMSLRVFVERLQCDELTTKLVAFKGAVSYELFYEAFLDLHRKIHSELHGGSASYVSDLKRIKDAMARSKHQFASNAQQDAHEFFNECLTLLETDVAYVLHPERLKSLLAKQEKDEQLGPLATRTSSSLARAKRVIDSDDDSDATEPQLQRPSPKPLAIVLEGDDDDERNASTAATTTTTTTTTKARSSPGENAVPQGAGAPRDICPVREMFDMEVTTALTCVECGDVSTVKEVYRDLSIALPDGFDSSEFEFSLAALLDGFFAPDRFERRCEKAGCHSQSVNVTRQLTRLPPILCVQLKRFKANFASGTYDKLRHLVKTPAQLDVAFCSAERTVVPGGPPDGVHVDVPPRRERVVALDADSSESESASPVRNVVVVAPPPNPPTPLPLMLPGKRTLADSDEEDAVEIIQGSPRAPPAKRANVIANDGDDDIIDDDIVNTSFNDLTTKAERGKSKAPVLMLDTSPIVASGASDTGMSYIKQREAIERALMKKGIKDVHVTSANTDAILEQYDLYSVICDENGGDDNDGNNTTSASLLAVTPPPPVPVPVPVPVPAARDSSVVPGGAGGAAADEIAVMVDDKSPPKAPRTRRKTSKVDASALWPEPVQTAQTSTSYTLHAVTYHCGRYATSGHYVTAVRKGADRWTLYNDSSVRDESEADALYSTANKREGYIYFFVHTNLNPK
jgi:ubiquitin C-terminal hydrolase